MKLNINQNLEDFTDSILKDIEPTHFKFNLNQLPEVNNFEIDIRKAPVFDTIFANLNKKTNHCLYWFELDTIEDATELNSLLNQGRKNLKVQYRVVPALNKNTDSAVLYVGIRQGGVRIYDKLSNISGRIIQHLGYYIKGSTQGLQLVHWAHNLNLNLNLYVIEFDKLPHEYLNVIEKLVAYKLKPLCGKH